MYSGTFQSFYSEHSNAGQFFLKPKRSEQSYDKSDDLPFKYSGGSNSERVQISENSLSFGSGPHLGRIDAVFNFSELCLFKNNVAQIYYNPVILGARFLG